MNTQKQSVSKLPQKRNPSTKNDIMRFVNHELQIDIKSIEELGNGVVYCKLFDRIYPGTGIMKKIKLNANKEWENQNNLKILQAIFEKKKIQKSIDIQKLSKQKFLDNLNFMQWYIKFYEEKTNDFKLYRSQDLNINPQSQVEEDDLVGSPQVQKKVKQNEENGNQNNSNEEDVVSIGSFFKTSEFNAEEMQQQYVFNTQAKDKKDLQLDLNASMLISPNMIKSEVQEYNKENLYTQDEQGTFRQDGLPQSKNKQRTVNMIGIDIHEQNLQISINQ